ncbi:SseB family protein [Dactylosporangium sp. NPDC048998]|uniref:SseB family protein n=1 Tax=Dactylosporangium sp. NPDC048998 TaxID=3363976 RepID=UPI003721C1AC
MSAPDPVQPAWLPGNEVEAELVTALAADDRQEFFRIIRDAPWYLPAFPDEPGGQRFLTHDLLDATYLLVFTSEQSLAGAVGGLVTAYTVTGHDELAVRWPDPAWRLAVNPGTPVDAWVTLPALAEAAAGSRVVPTLAQLADRPAGPATDPAIDHGIDAALDDYLGRLNQVRLAVPVTGGQHPRYLVTRTEAGPAIEAFTSPEALAARHPDGVPWTSAGLSDLLADWPGEEYDLVVDPGTDAALRLPGPDLPGLLLWAPEPASAPEGGATSPNIAGIEYIEREQYNGDGTKRGESDGSSGLGESAHRGR